jgi:hypothetical protein
MNLDSVCAYDRYTGCIESFDPHRKWGNKRAIMRAEVNDEQVPVRTVIRTVPKTVMSTMTRTAMRTEIQLMMSCIEL